MRAQNKEGNLAWHQRIKAGNVAKVGAGAGAAGLLGWAMLDPNADEKIGEATDNLGSFVGSAVGGLGGGLLHGLFPLCILLLIPLCCVCSCVLMFMMIGKNE